MNEVRVEKAENGYVVVVFNTRYTRTHDSTKPIELRFIYRTLDEVFIKVKEYFIGGE